MLTKVRCACGWVLDEADAVAGAEVACEECGRVVRVPALPPGVGVVGTARVEPAEVTTVPDLEEESAPQAGRLNEAWESGGEGVDEEPKFASLEQLMPPSRPGRGAAAANPAGTRVEWRRYYRSYPAVIAIAVATVALGVAGGVVKHPALGALAAVGACAVAVDVARVRRKFRVGEVCPAVVVSQRPPLVAVRADLAAAGAEPRPAVKVVAQPLWRLLGGAPAVGMRLAAVAEYAGPARGGGGGGWRDFDPEVLRCATADEVEVGRVTWSIAEQEWRALEGDLARCPSPVRPGLYTLWDENRQGRRRTRWRWIGAVMAVGALGVAIGLLAWYMQGHEPAAMSPNAVPGRVHTDWGR